MSPQKGKCHSYKFDFRIFFEIDESDLFKFIPQMCLGFVGILNFVHHHLSSFRHPEDPKMNFFPK